MVGSVVGSAVVTASRGLCWLGTPAGFDGGSSAGFASGISKPKNSEAASGSGCVEGGGGEPLGPEVVLSVLMTGASRSEAFRSMRRISGSDFSTCNVDGDFLFHSIIHSDPGAKVMDATEGSSFRSKREVCDGVAPVSLRPRLEEDPQEQRVS